MEESLVEEEDWKKNRVGGQVRSSRKEQVGCMCWASQRGHQGGTWMTGQEFQEQPGPEADAFASLQHGDGIRAGDQVGPCQKKLRTRKGRRQRTGPRVAEFKVSLRAARWGAAEGGDLPNRREAKSTSSKGGSSWASNADRSKKFKFRFSFSHSVIWLFCDPKVTARQASCITIQTYSNSSLLMG